MISSLGETNSSLTQDIGKDRGLMLDRNNVKKVEKI
jgi:hypothetical protein